MSDFQISNTVISTWELILNKFSFRLKRRTFAVASPKPHHGASLKDFHSPSTTPVQAPPSPKPQVGQASIKDYSPTRTETPPYPTALNEVDDQQSQQQKPLPSPPISIQSPNYHQQQVDLPTPPPPLPPTEPDQAEGWKEEVRFILHLFFYIFLNFFYL